MVLCRCFVDMQLVFSIGDSHLRPTKNSFAFSNSTFFFGGFSFESFMTLRLWNSYAHSSVSVFVSHESHTASDCLFGEPIKSQIATSGNRIARSTDRSNACRKLFRFAFVCESTHALFAIKDWSRWISTRRKSLWNEKTSWAKTEKQIWLYEKTMRRRNDENKWRRNSGKLHLWRWR